MPISPEQATAAAAGIRGNVLSETQRLTQPVMDAGVGALQNMQGIGDVYAQYAAEPWQQTMALDPNVNQQIGTTIDPSQYQFGGLDAATGMQVSSVTPQQANLQVGAVGAPGDVTGEFTMGQVDLPGQLDYNAIMADPMTQFLKDQYSTNSAQQLARMGMTGSTQGIREMGRAGMQAGLESRDRLYQQGLDRFGMGSQNAARMLAGQQAGSQQAQANAANRLQAALATAANQSGLEGQNARNALQASMANQQAQMWGGDQSLAANEALFNQNLANQNLNQQNYQNAFNQGAWGTETGLQGAGDYYNTQMGIAGLGMNALGNQLTGLENYGAGMTQDVFGLSNTQAAQQAAEDAQRNALIASGVNAAANLAGQVDWGNLF